MNTEEIIAQIARIRESANDLITSELQKRAIKGIVPAHGPVLAYLFEQKKPVSIKSVVDKVGRVKSTVTVMIRTLESHGYLRKLPCETDNRITMIELTEKGHKLRKDFEEISVILRKTVYGTMKDNRRRQLVKLLSEIEYNIRS